MVTQVPILDADGVVQIDATVAFLEVLDAIADSQWLMLAPRISLRLQKDVSFRVRFGPTGDEIEVIGTPYYWRGPYIGLKVRPGTGGALQLAQDLRQRLLAAASEPASPLPPSPPIPEKDDFLPVVPPPTAPSTTQEPPDSSDFTETDYVDFNAIVAHIRDDKSTGASDAPSPEAESEPSSPEVPPAPQVSPPVAPAIAELAQRPAAPIATPGEAPPAVPEPQAALPGWSGSTCGGFQTKALLLRFPEKGGGLPLPEAPTLYRVLSVLAAQEASGQLTLKTKDQEAALYLRKGTLLGVDPLGTNFDDHFAAHLLAEKAIEQGPLDEAIAHAQAFDKTLPVALYEKRAIGMDVMGKTLRELKQRLLFDLLSHPIPLAFRFVPRTKFGRKFDPMRLHLAGNLVEFVRSQLKDKYLADLEPLLADYKFKYVQMSDSEIIPLDVLGLDDKQRHAIKHVLHGPNRLNETYSLCLLTRHGTARLVTLLHHFGLINWLDRPGEVAGAETIEDRLDATVRAIEALDLFQRLEVHWGAHPRKLEIAFQRYNEKYGPDSVLHRHSPEAAVLCDRIMACVKSAYDHLSVKRQRREYRLEKQGEMRVKRAAEFLVKQADLVRFRGEWDEAFDLLEAAIDMWEHPAFVSKRLQWKEERRG